MRLVWLNLCERQDAERVNHGQGINSMMPDGQSTGGRINTPLQKESNNSIGELFGRIQVCRPHEAVVIRQIMFCVIVGHIGYAWLPVYEGMAAYGAVADPVETHVNGF